MTRSRSVATTLTVLMALGVLSSALAAQSTSAGAAAGIVTGSEGQPLGGVRVELIPVGGGVPLVLETSPEGAFLFPLVDPGEYELLAERLGYWPVRVAPLPIVTGRRLDVAVTLTAADGPVEAPLTVGFAGKALAEASVPGRSRRFDGWQLQLPRRRADAGELAALSTRSERSLEEVEGLPRHFTTTVVEGIGFQPVHHGASGDGGMGSLLVPARALSTAELLAGHPDVEWPGTAGALLLTTLPGPASKAGGEAAAVWSGEDIAPDSETPPGYTAFRGGLSGGTRFYQDSGYVRVFAEAEQDESPVRYWTGRAGAVESFQAAGLDVGPLVGARAGAAERLNAGAGFGWRFPGDRSVRFSALYGQGEQDHLLSGFSGLDVPATVEGEDLVAVVAGHAPFGEAVVVEVRAGLGRSTREYASRGLVETSLGDAAVVFVPGGVHLGGDPGFPAVLERSGFSGQATAHVRGAGHHVKLGGGLNVATHERTHSFGRQGVYVFGGPTEFADRVGVFEAAAGPGPTTRFTVPELFAYGQDTWTIAPGLDLTTGLRYEVELLPTDDLARNARWQELTGMDTGALPSSVAVLGLVAGFDWNVRQRNEWMVRGAFAVHGGDVAPDLLAEALSYDGRITALRAVGDVTTPVSLGPRLTILSPDIAPPVTTRASIGLTRALGQSAALHVDAVLRQTMNLPERSDLNLPVNAPFEDQYGRPVYGRLARAGSLIHAEPGTNRRFGEFDAVSGVAAGASSTYWGVTGALEKRAGYFRMAASYTYSRTVDDWLSASSSVPLLGLSPLTGLAEVDEWDEGVSAFDVPHRMVLASELTLPFARAITLGGFWRVESGRPFTPGHGLAIDANADGVAGNDPAFVDDSIEGIPELQEEWACLRTSAGQFAERNSCRHRTRTLLDLWLGLRFPSLGTVTPELRVEALALDGEGWDRWDTALYVVDPAGEVVVDEAAGRVTVPLMVNPRFGEPTVAIRELARVRISFRMVF